jgi:hypothetical protein
MAGPYDSLNSPTVLNDGVEGFVILNAAGVPQSLSLTLPAAGIPCALVIATTNPLLDNLNTNSGAPLSSHMLDMSNRSPAFTSD